MSAYTDLVIPTGNFLRPNGLGGYIIRQSDLSSWWRCNLEKFYEERARREPEAPQPSILSASEYGSVIHHATMVMEQALLEGSEDPLALALRTFEHYWSPEHIGELPGCAWPNEWLPMHTYGGLRERGRRTLTVYYDIIRMDVSSLLALEFRFAVPLRIGGRLHTFTGTVDRLSIRTHYSKPYISVDDNKTGKKYTYLRYNMQGTGYAYASTLPEFWTGWAESGVDPTETFDPADMKRMEDLFGSYQYKHHRASEQGTKLASRRFRWVDLKEIKMSDGGWRTEQDYARFHLVVHGYVKSVEAEAYSLNTTGEICRYCAFRNSCAGIGIADELDGAPNRKVSTP